MNCRPNILVVDDDATARLLMSAALRKVGCEVTVAAGGAEALKKAAENRFDMVMLDVEMPDMSGLEVCARLRAQAGELLPIVMVTGLDDVHSIENAYESGATDFIPKPINWALLGHRVRYLLRASKTVLELRDAHVHNAAIIDAIPDTLIRVHETGRVIDVRSDERYPNSSLVPGIGQPFVVSYPSDVAATLASELRRVFASGAAQNTEFSLSNIDGTPRHYEARIALLNPTEALCLMRDITARKQAETALVLSQATLQQAQAVARLGSWYVDLETLEERWSLEIYRIFGLAQDTRAAHLSFFELVHKDDVALVRQAWHLALAGKAYTIEYRITTRRGTAWLLEQCELICDDNGRLHRIVGTIQDITERKETENRIANLAYVDSLTRLPNRESFLARLGREIKRACFQGSRLGILFMDFDGFKGINDTLGHQAGDLILQAAADRLRAAIRPSDMASRVDGVESDTLLARLGGDEFTALILDLTDPKDALLAASRISEKMRQPFHVKGRELRLTASIGIAVYPDDGNDVLTLLKHADTAMYHAKELGRDNYQLYTTALTQRAVQRMDMERDLHGALEKAQFFLAYQPQFDVRAGRITAVEALIRWPHPGRRLIPPLDFIPVAEANGLIVPIGRQVMCMACAAAANWQRTKLGLRVAVNLSPRQLKAPDLVENVRDILVETGLAPELLELEVTESSLMEDSAATLATLRTLRELGVRIALDDFGTGYSSMSYLKRMPLTTLKIDRSFVTGLPCDRESDSIVRAILSMAKSLGISVTAEGVETLDQVRVLTAMDCDMLQGYYYSRPIIADQIAEVVNTIVTRDELAIGPTSSVLAIRAAGH